jgi:hypothetical protein
MHVLDPNRDMPPKYQNYICIDNHGRAATGILAAQTATSIRLARQE